ncbi:MAG: c-type cytochrome [Gallionella sp.]
MKVRYLIAMAAALTVSTAAFAVDKEETLFIEGNCNNCHAVDHKTVGPSLIEIAAKYKDDKQAQEKLEKKVRAGGSGSWGIMPMPKTRQSFSDENIQLLVTWILKQKAKPEAAQKADGKTDPKK